MPRLLAVAQERKNAVSGDIQLESTTETERSPRVVSIEKGAEWLGQMQKAIEAGGQGPIALPDANAFTFVTTMYLYCTTKLGTCPFILDTVLEGDVINARGSGSPECPIMSQFWRQWLNNDLEQRAKYLLSIGNASALATFNQNQRPKYLRCKDTVANELKQAPATRYASSGTVAQSVTRTTRFLTEVRNKQVDVYSATGVDFAKPKGSDDKKKGEKPGK